MKILVIGDGAREHAMVWKLAQSPKVTEIYVTPGNAGTAQIAQNLNISPADITKLIKVALEKRVNLTVVGPEAPLASGIADEFLIRGMQIFGPTKAATRIESSKVFAKELMQKHNIPCARSMSFSSYAEAKEYVMKLSPPIVIKADGLAAGKGVTVASTIPQAVDTLANIMEAKAFGAAGDRVVIEEHLKGKEVSTFAFTDAHTTVPMVAACDYKSVFDGGQGPNTGGMGSYSPPDFFSPSLAKAVAETIMAPVLRALHDMGTPYKSVLYSGLMLTDDGPKALEFNARFGDPEAQVILPRLKTDLFDIMLAIADHNLNEMNNIEWSEDACVGVVMASAGYPDSYKTGFPITGLNNLDKDILVFHAATKVVPGGEVVTNGGRVLTVVATGKTITEAREKVYTNISRINFEGCHYRKDIAKIDVSK